MSDKPFDEDAKVVVRSDRAIPSRPGGYFGVHQPIRPPTPSPPLEVQPDDEVLARQIRSVLNAEGRIPPYSVAVTVINGPAELDGTVTLEFQSTLATALAKSVPGILTVANRLKVTSY